jgi:hypothetical protein
VGVISAGDDVKGKSMGLSDEKMRWRTRGEVGMRLGKYCHAENLGDGCTGYVLQK